MTVAFELQRPLWEVYEYTPQELADWLAFFRLRNERIKKEAEKSKPKGRKMPTVNRRN